MVAVPGDVVAWDEGGLTVNADRALYTEGETSRLRELLAATAAQNPRILREAGFGPEHDILLLHHGGSYGRFDPRRVPVGMYFMMGDNRDNSADSRDFGFVPRRNIVGRATRVLISLDPERYYVPRRGRYLARLN